MAEIKKLSCGGQSKTGHKARRRNHVESSAGGQVFFDQNPPPRNLRLEMSLLAAAMIDTETAALIFKKVVPEDFYQEAHRIIACTISERIEAGKPTDSICILESLKSQGLIKKVGGGTFLGKILTEPGPWADPEKYCQELKDLAGRRKALKVFKALAQSCYENTDLRNLLAQARRKIDLVRDYVEPGDQGRRAGLRFIPVANLEPKPPNWLICDLIEQDTLIQIFGDPGCGKSFVGIDIACCVATGIDFHGFQVPRAKPSLYISGEGQNGIARKFTAWKNSRKVDFTEKPLFLSTTPASICDAASAVAIQQAIEDIGIEPGLVVVDTPARNFGPGDENSTADMTAFISTLDQIRTRYRCTILLIHHTGHTDKTRGRGAIALKAPWMQSIAYARMIKKSFGLKIPK